MSEGSANLGARSVAFREHVESLDTVDRVEKAVVDGHHYWKVYPTEPVITPDVADALARHGLSATPDEDGLLVETGSVVFEGEGVELIQNAVQGVIDRRERNPMEIATEAARMAEEGDEAFDDIEDVESVSDLLEQISKIDQIVETLYFDDDGEPLIDPDDDIDWIVMALPPEAIDDV